MFPSSPLVSISRNAWILVCLITIPSVLVVDTSGIEPPTGWLWELPALPLSYMPDSRLKIATEQALSRVLKLV